MNIAKTIIFTLVITGLFVVSSHTAHAEVENSTVILRYDRIGNDPLHPDSITKEQFITHIKELRKNRIKVAPLSKATHALPESSVAIVINHADDQTVANIEDMVDTYELPITVLLSEKALTQPKDQSWYELRGENLITFGITPTESESLVDKTLEERATLINNTVNKYRDVFDTTPTVFAYPKGEYSNSLKQQLSTYKFTAALTEDNGAVHAKSDPLTLPTMVIDKSYAPAEPFMMAVRTLPLYVNDVLPEDNLIDTPTPVIGFTVDPTLRNPENIACFASDVGKLDIKLVANNRVEIRPKKPFIYRNTRIKCTLPDDTTSVSQQNWRSFSMTLTNPSIVESNSAETLFQQ